MFGHFGRVRDRAEEGEGYMDLWGAPPHGGPRGALLQIPVQWLTRGHPERASLTHHFKHDGGFCDMSLGYAGHEGVGGT